MKACRTALPAVPNLIVERIILFDLALSVDAHAPHPTIQAQRALRQRKVLKRLLELVYSGSQRRHEPPLFSLSC
jgi:hypothetical protein